MQRPMSDFLPTNVVRLAPNVELPESSIRWKFSRGSGPGGQNVNKVNSRAELWVQVAAFSMLNSGAIARLRKLSASRLTAQDEIHIVGSEHRSQDANRSSALERLGELVLRAMVEPKVRRKTRPSKASKLRRLEGKKRRGDVKRARQGRSFD